jgi:hypothetical protein
MAALYLSYEIRAPDGPPGAQAETARRKVKTDQLRIPITFLEILTFDTSEEIG